MAAAAAAEGGASAEAGEGPVLSLVTKRLRALRKKQKRILQMEAAVAEGKPLNPEQSETLRSKPAVEVLIDEYERLRSPLASALHQELLSHASALPLSPHNTNSPGDEVVEDLVALMYFGTLFDVRPQGDFTATMLARALERGCCLTYDVVPDDDEGDAADMLAETDLDAISMLGALVASRPMRSGASHQAALRECVRHARLWFTRSDQPIQPRTPFTYAGLRARLDKILGSEYFIRTPEIKGGEDLAAAAGKYATACPVQIHDAAAAMEVMLQTGQVEGDPALYQQKEEESEEFQENEVDPDHHNDAADEAAKMDEAEVLNPPGENAVGQHEQEKLEADVEEHYQRDAEFNGQQHIPRKSYYNQRGGGRGGGRRGYPNGRGGRGGRGGGGYQNGRSQYYDSGYYSRNYYNARGRGGRSGGSSMYNNHGGHGPRNSELGTGA